MKRDNIEINLMGYDNGIGISPPRPQPEGRPLEYDNRKIHFHKSSKNFKNKRILDNLWTTHKHLQKIGDKIVLLMQNHISKSILQPTTIARRRPGITGGSKRLLAVDQQKVIVTVPKRNPEIYCITLKIVPQSVYYSNSKLSRNIGPNEPDQTVRVKIITRIVVFRRTISSRKKTASVILSPGDINIELSDVKVLTLTLMDHV
ncbi:hypothetical protein AGLY_002110 [Aphis glycines]|uniref:Uncharacterized protein n=1 Tax=Aphis glycines TaxID=307491 RepID=A0A6G0U3R0_APHGL|nr:hypothetical protein AGLY_002110 [Aphis glycines]